MFPKILIPLNGSRGSERVFHNIRNEISPGSEVILLQIVPPDSEAESERYVLSGGVQQDEVGRFEAIAYLHGVAERYDEGSEHWRCEVITYASVAEAILDFAILERVDLIAMYASSDAGIADYVVSNVSVDVAGGRLIDVRVFGLGQVVVSS